MALEPGQQLLHYRLIEIIGKGGMGEVWKALDAKLNRHVAIKILPPQLTDNEERRLRFLREAQTAAALSHPNIAVIHEVSEHEGIPFLVMELLDGKSLQEVAARRPMPVERWVDHALPIAEALAHAHRNGVVHRDLKAANVMVTAEGHVKLLDFGLAKLLQPDAPAEADQAVPNRLDTISAELTRAGSVLGTVPYMSPEQARGEAVDHRTDIFSFGVLLYELITGALPFTGNSDIESLNATLTHEPSRPSERVAGLPLDADRVIGKTMEKEPGRRYQSADEIVTDLRNLKRDLDTGRVTIVGSGSIAPAAAPSPAMRKPSHKWIGAAVGVLVVLAAVWGVLQLRPGDDTGSATATPDAASPDATAQPAADTPERIVVLPFENLGAPEDEFFAAGVTEEIIARLASLRDLSVISRSSAFQYDRTGKTLADIGRDFDVGHVLEGTVRWARSGGVSRVRISPQLVRVADDTSIWGDSIDAPMEDIFQVQTQIAEQVIDALDVVLLAPERALIESRPTENQEAYQAYLRGKEALLFNPTEEITEQMFRRAVELDPEFSEAWAGLSRAHSWRFHGGDRTEERCRASREAADEALRLTPDSPDAHLALGVYHYRCFRDYERAIAATEVAEAARPNDVEIQFTKGAFLKRQGDFRGALRLNSRVLELDPLHYKAAWEAAFIHQLLREYPESKRFHEQAIAIKPDDAQNYTQYADTLVAWKGSTDEAQAVLDAMPATGDRLSEFSLFTFDYLAGHYEEALARLDRLPEMIEGQETLNLRAIGEAKCYEALGQTSRARESWEAAAALLEGLSRERPEDFRVFSDLGPVLAALGREDEALEAARRGVRLMPPSKDVEAAMTPARNLAETLVRLGRIDDAFAEVEGILGKPGRLSIGVMRVEPVWGAVVGDARFGRLEERLGGR